MLRGQLDRLAVAERRRGAACRPARGEVEEYAGLVEGEVVNRIQVSADEAREAKATLDLMLEITA